MRHTPSSYARDPYWIVARFDGLDANKAPFKQGDRLFYFPVGKRIYAGAAGVDAAQRFESERADEDAYNGYGSAY